MRLHHRCWCIDMPDLQACPAKPSLKHTRAPESFVDKKLHSDSTNTLRSSFDSSNWTLTTNCIIQLHLILHLTMAQKPLVNQIIERKSVIDKRSPELENPWLGGLTLLTCHCDL